MGLISLYSTIVTYMYMYLVSKAIEFVEKTQNKGYYADQGHSMSSGSVSMESPYATSY